MVKVDVVSLSRSIFEAVDDGWRAEEVSRRENKVLSISAPRHDAAGGNCDRTRRSRH